MQIEQVTFHNTSIDVAVIDGKPFVALKPICDALGLHWSKQVNSLKSDPVLSSTMRETRTVAADGKVRSMICLPIDFLNGWLFKVDAKRYRGERRELIIQYQRECYRVLAAHFLGGGAHSPAAAPVAPAAALEQVQAAVERSARREAAMVRCELAAVARRHGITDADEFLTLAGEALSPSAPEPRRVGTWPPAQYEHAAGAVHPATFSRALARMSQSPFGWSCSSGEGRG